MILFPFLPLEIALPLPAISISAALLSQAHEQCSLHEMANEPGSPGSSSNSNNCRNSEISMSELNLTVQRLSNQAFQLAQEAAQQSGDLVELKAQAQALNSQLDQLLPEIQSAPAVQQPELNRAWSDARLDVGYVLSDGELSPSTRLFYFLQNLK